MILKWFTKDSWLYLLLHSSLRKSIDVLKIIILLSKTRPLPYPQFLSFLLLNFGFFCGRTETARNKFEPIINAAGNAVNRPDKGVTSAPHHAQSDPIIAHVCSRSLRWIGLFKSIKLMRQADKSTRQGRRIAAMGCVGKADFPQGQARWFVPVGWEACCDLIKNWQMLDRKSIVHLALRHVLP